MTDDIFEWSKMTIGTCQNGFTVVDYLRKLADGLAEAEEIKVE